MVIEYRMDSDLKKINEAVRDILDKIRVLALDEDTLFDIRLCLEEALVNAVKYGNKMCKELPVEIRCRAEGGILEIDVKDQGEGFDYQHLIDPTRDENLDKPRGRGVFLIKKFMDRVEFLDNGSRIRMVKMLKRGGA